MLACPHSFERWRCGCVGVFRRYTSWHAATRAWLRATTEEQSAASRLARAMRSSAMALARVVRTMAAGFVMDLFSLRYKMIVAGGRHGESGVRRRGNNGSEDEHGA